MITGDLKISSENHAKISYSEKNNRFNLLPGDGRNIVYLNDEEVFSPMPLKAYDLIDFGETKLIFIPLCGEQFTWKKEGRLMGLLGWLFGQEKKGKPDVLERPKASEARTNEESGGESNEEFNEESDRSSDKGSNKESGSRTAMPVFLAGNIQGIGDREQQEDSFAVFNVSDTGGQETKGLLAVVADGMGGMADGQEASRCTVDTFSPAFPASGTGIRLYRNGSIRALLKPAERFFPKQAAGAGLRLPPCILEGISCIGSASGTAPFI